jgi:predicted membrane protein
MFEGQKTWVFWIGLIILCLASVTLFSTVWYYSMSYWMFGVMGSSFWILMVPPIVGAVVFILIGLYMMKSGTKKEEGREVQLLKQ